MSQTDQHWHVMDHYTADHRLYTDRALARQWVRRHGGEPIVQIEECSERCLEEIEQGSKAASSDRRAEGDG